MRPPAHLLKLNQQALFLSLIAAAYPMTCYSDSAGRAAFIIGTVDAVAPDGSRRALETGSEINSGDSINTSAGARAQLRFSDGGYVSLQPNTVFRVDQFNYQNKTDGQEKGFFSLLKGGLRAITGAIGKVNRETYQVATPNATIGIRGTGYKAEIRDGGLFVSVGEGVISLTNSVGLLVVSAGNAAYVASPDSSPEPSKEQPQTPPAPLQPITQSSSTSTIIVPNLPSMASGSGYTLGYAYLGVDATNGRGQLSNVNAVFNSSSQLLSFNDGTNSGNLAGGKITFSATDGIIGWGRWTENFTANVPPNGSVLTPATFDYVIGIPTAVMPTTGTATYNLMGYTNPTATDGSTGWNVSGNLSVTFSTTNTIGVNMTVANAVDNFIVAGSGSGSGATFTGTISTSGTVCGSGCSTSISGFFAGTDASRAGLSYQVTDGNNRNILGAAAFAKQ